jgi:hypothetical protein
LKIFLTQFGSTLPLTPGPPVRLRDDQKVRTTIKSVIWGVFVPKSQCFFTQPLITRSPVPTSGPPDYAPVAASPIVFQTGRPARARPGHDLARPDAARHYAARSLFRAEPCWASGRTGGPGTALWPIFRAGPARRRGWPDGP